MHKQLMFYGLHFEQYIDGELVEVGTVRKCTKHNIIEIMKRQGWSITIQRSKHMPTSSQYAAIDANHRKVLRELIADPNHKINGITERAMLRRGYINHYEGGEVYVTDEGLKFLHADSIEDAKLIAPAHKPQPQAQTAAVIESAHIAPFVHDETHVALRDMRDAALSLVESVVSQKAPEVLPVLMQVRRVNRILGE